MNNRSRPNPCSMLALLAGLWMSSATSGAGQPAAVDFHALGHGPGWQLDIDQAGGRLNFTAEAGSGSYRFVKLGPDLTRGNIKAVTYRIVDDTHHMNVVVLEMFCQDAQSGKAYAATVNVHLDGRKYTGCGEPVVERSRDSW